MKKVQLSVDVKQEFIQLLKTRFEQNSGRHEGIEWSEVGERLEHYPEKLSILHNMEQTGGEPDVIGREKNTFIFGDCSKESPKGRRSVCYDREALESRKKHKPATSMAEMAADIGASIMTEEEYRHLQTLGAFDTKTSSWIHTPERIRKLGGALFCDRRYDTVFVYHNGAESYYASRGFRCTLKV